MKEFQASQLVLEVRNTASYFTLWILSKSLLND